MSKAMPWVRFFPSDWLGGTRGLSPRATALYITMVCLMYEKDGPIPADIDWLSRTCSMGRKQTAAALTDLITKGKITEQEDGRLFNGKAAIEIDQRKKYSTRQRDRVPTTKGTKPLGTLNGQEATASHGLAGPLESTTTTRVQSQKESTDVDSPNANPDGFASDVGASDLLAADDEKRSKEEAKKIGDDFARWYARYPHKVGKARAEKAYRQARRRASFDQLLSGLDRYVRDKPVARPWQNPATWLNGDSWLDEPAPATTPPRATGPPPRRQAARDDWDDLLDEERRQRHGTNEEVIEHGDDAPTRRGASGNRR